MIAYVDEFGILSDTPPDKNVKIDRPIPPTVRNSNDLNVEASIRTGTVTFFDASKGYGFIKDAASGESIFVHTNSSSLELKEHLKVSFDVEYGPHGIAAVNVRAAG